MTLIIAVDPGKKTGWASYDTTANVFASQEAPGDEFIDRVVPWLGPSHAHDRAAAGPVRIVVERFVITAGTMRTSRGDENWSIEQIGILRHHARWAGVAFELQSAGDAKKFSPDDRLRTIGWYTPGRGHANDAARHALLNVARHHHDVLVRLLRSQ